MTDEASPAIFLVGLAALLLAARVLGELARKLSMPAVAGELLAGVLLGPTVLGRLAPGSVAALFPPGKPAIMLSGYTLLSSVLLLTLAGLEIDLSVVLRRRRGAALTSVLGLLLPLSLGAALGLALPDRFLVDPSHRWLFALFVGTALGISALPVIAKTLLDLGYLRTPLGSLVMAAAMIDDLVGWLLFSLLVGPMRGHGDVGSFALRSCLILLFVGVVMLPGRAFFDRILARLERDRMRAPGRVLSTVIILGVLGAAISQAIGVHAVFGAFIVAVAIGDSAHLRAETRSRIHEFVGNVFAPVFFAAVGLRVDFVAAFEPLLVLAVIAVACVGKILGASLGARLGGMGPRESWSVGFAMNSRGAMEIILALIALETGLIRPELYVALVVMALVTSLLSGPVMSRLLATRGVPDVRRLLEQGAVVPGLRARSAREALRELAQALAAGTSFDGETLARSASEEATTTEGLVGGVAISSARVEGLEHPLLALGRSAEGIDFDAVDGEPSRIIFLLLLSARHESQAIDLQASIALKLASPAQRTAILAATSRAETLEAFGRAPALGAAA